jgi:hypothetical protein
MLAAVCVGCNRPAPAADEASAVIRIPVQSTVDTAMDAGEHTIRHLLMSRTFIGRRVRVSGRCLRGPHALGQPPRSNQWQLEADGVAMFVIGNPPPECSPGVRNDSLTVTALVAEDTLPAIGDLPPVPRSYLILIEAQPK